MHTVKGTTPKALQRKLQQQGTNNGVGNGESSFRVLYYGTASAGSVPFMWESQPGTPKHALAESSLPPLTPPPSYHQFTPKSNYISSKRSCFLRTIFLSSSRKTDVAASPPPSFSCSVSSSSSSSSSSSHVRSLQSTPVSKTEVRRKRWSPVKPASEVACGGSPTSTLCFVSGFTKGYRVKKVKNAMLSFVRHGK